VSRKSGTGGKGGRLDVGAKGIGLEELGRSGTHRRGYPWWHTSSGGRATVRGRSAVNGGRLLSREAVRRPRGAQDGGDDARGGTAWADVVEVLGGGWHSLVRGEQWWGVASGGGGR
jgi:hypothetical protein